MAELNEIRSAEVIFPNIDAGATGRHVYYLLHSRGYKVKDVAQILEALDAFAVQVALEAADSPYVGRLLACMAPGVSYSAVQLLTLLGLKSRQTLRMHYLNPAIREGLVEMTIPEKPSSRNQRYRRTEPYL